MRRQWVIGLALVVAGLALVSQAAPAQDPVPGPGSVPATGSLYAVPPNPVFSLRPGPDAAEEPPPPQGLMKKCLGKCKSCLNKYGLCCWTHHNTLGCNSFEAQYRFVFGSCRTFYGEPCERRPPTPPAGAPGSPGAPRGYGSGPGGCACP